jgi:hypothetical protein
MSVTALYQDSHRYSHLLCYFSGLEVYFAAGGSIVGFTPDGCSQKVVSGKPEHPCSIAGIALGIYAQVKPKG